jgi:hypothetical protein
MEHFRVVFACVGGEFVSSDIEAVSCVFFRSLAMSGAAESVFVDFTTVQAEV